MSIVHYLLDVYFAAALGIAGITKLDNSHGFMKTLNNYQFPGWSISIIKIIFPWIEILFAVFLLVTNGIYKLFITMLIFILFLFFMYINNYLYGKNTSNDNCGCYGKSLREKEEVNIKKFVSAVQLFLSIFLVLLTIWRNTLPTNFYFGSSILFIIGFIWLLLRTWKRNTMSLGTTNDKSVKEG